MTNTLRIVVFLFLSFTFQAQEDPALAKATDQKIQGKWQQTETSKLNGDKKPGRDVLILNKDHGYSWSKAGEKKAESGKWKIDNYGKTSNTGKMMELLVLKSKAGKNSIFINQLADSALVLRVYDYSKGAPAKDDFTDLHFIRSK